jgi:UDP-3-O-[3-hydroxymyristoyl] glucosamine N-acyltransferase
MELSLSEIQRYVGGRLEGDADTMISGVNSLELAEKGEISFAESERYLECARQSSASALIVPEGFPETGGVNWLYVRDPRQAFIAVMMLFDQSEEERVSFGIHPRAVIAERGVSLGERVAIAECAVIRGDVRIGAGTSIESGVHLGQGVAIGRDCRIGPNAVLMPKVVIGDRVIIHAGTVIGGDGFGYIWSDDRRTKIPQLGTVQIDDDVEIGCNVCIDRATFGVTRIRRGVKIDNLVQIAHNNDIGEHSILVSQVGLSGSVTLGERVTLAGQVGVADHVAIGNGATAAARTGVSKDIKSGQVVWGAPNRPIKQVMRELACLSRLPRLFSQVRTLAARLSELEKKVGQG